MCAPPSYPEKLNKHIKSPMQLTYIGLSIPTSLLYSVHTNSLVDKLDEAIMSVPMMTTVLIN